MTEQDAAHDDSHEGNTPVRTYDDAGRLISEVPFERGIMQGVYRLWQDGKPTLELPFEQGKPHGLGVWYDPPGEVRLRMSFINGLKHGPAEVFEKGCLLSRLSYGGDVLDGLVTVEQAPGVPAAADIPFAGGAISGQALYRDPAGREVRREQWQGGQRQGLQQDRDPGGRLMAERRFTAGRLDGAETVFDPSASGPVDQPRQIHWWQAGKLVGQQLFGPKGKEIRRDGVIPCAGATPAAPDGSGQAPTGHGVAGWWSRLQSLVRRKGEGQ